MKKIAFALSLLLVGCVGAPTQHVDWASSQSVGATITKSRDEFKKVTNWVGPSYQDRAFEGFLFMRAWRFDSDGVPQYQIYVSSHHGGRWYFFRDAYDIQGHRLEFTKIASEVTSCSAYSCSYREDFGISLDAKYLEEAAKTGMQFKASGSGGEMVFSMPSTYFAAMLSATK